MKVLKILSEQVHKAGYVVRQELCESPVKGEPPVKLTSAYTPQGNYIGNPSLARYLCGRRGIRPECRRPDSTVCSIGFSGRDGEWYGWSHRALCGFKIGSRCRKRDSHYRSRKDGGRGPWTAKTVADARQMARDFAESVA
jgi:hypothetical protein